MRKSFGAPWYRQHTVAGRLPLGFIADWRFEVTEVRKPTDERQYRSMSIHVIISTPIYVLGLRSFIGSRFWASRFHGGQMQSFFVQGHGVPPCGKRTKTERPSVFPDMR